ncbi:HAD-IA family hydrolase [Pollutimonas harenae]|uniref:phosphoglycolate phosphatase n=1 Tax=Pollutimonas harenae TaxID=657015 RepID=A0A853GTG8_9BURK|nr:HAD-IA family hydrolase [Pollutimonas harenae]NYT85521.1 HAD-IA family hydrolase [Pollutimonas harenae]TEA70608.1 HAD family hydrolase [Pollutimonas harenae]
MKRYEAVIFDWDGTVMDSTHSIVAAIQGACTDLALPVPSASEASWVIGLSLQSALYHCVPTLTEERMDEFLDRYRFHFLSRDPHIKLFDGIAGLLLELRASRVSLGVATGKSRVGLDRVLDAMQLRSHFDATRCADESFSKPHPAMLLELMEELGLEPDRVLMVGDTSHDIQMATAAGVDSMAVTYGAHEPSVLLAAEPTVVVGSVPEMREWVLARV